MQKSGRLSEKSLAILQECGIKFPMSNNKLTTEASNFPLDILFLRDDDIPEYVEKKVADIGIIGQNGFLESKKDILEVEKLGFGGCRLSLAVRRAENFTDLSYFNGKKIATTYPNILSDFCKKNNIDASIEVISGSVEIAPGIGLSDGICDIVSSGSTLLSNGLKEVYKIMDSQSILVANKNLSADEQKILDRLLFRMRSVLSGKDTKYILLNAPNDKIDQIASIIPGMKSPTILPLKKEGWSSLHSVIKEDQFWDVIDELKDNGAEGILIVPIEKMIL